ncbi:MAG: tocopherol cyclase family protein, partial [Ruminococcus sp.]|nr:tocopherol cyclase family protein [Ruminococcus sp.]
NVGYGAGDAMRAVNAFEMYWHAEGMKTLYTGTVTFGGRRYSVTPETCYGYADKNWGADFTSPWIWLSSNCMESRITGKKLKNSVFDIGGGRPRVFGVSLDRILLGAFYYEGREFEFNFSKVWTRPKTLFRAFETETEIVWHIQQSTPKYVMRTCIHCRKDEMLLINYEAPDGSKQHNRLWNGGTGKGRIKLFERRHGSLELIDDINVSHVGCEYGEFC